MRRVLAILVLGLLGLGPAAAQAGDPANGKQLAKDMCVACHGLDGIGTTAAFPNIGGQPEMYLIYAFTRYGTLQHNVVHEPFYMSGDVVLDLAAYYSGLRWQTGVQPTGLVGGDPQAGRAKAEACVVCHFNGMAPFVDQVPYFELPHLAGQSEMYLYAALQAYRDGYRLIGNGRKKLPKAKSNLSDQDMRDLAAYYASLGR